MNNKLDERIEEYVLKDIPKDIISLANQANYDLYYGPIDDDDYPGFVKAIDKVKEYLYDINTLYVDNFTEEIMDREPEQYVECPECNGDGCEYCEDGCVEICSEWYQYDRREILSATFGKELAHHLY